MTPSSPDITIPGTENMEARFAWLEAKAIDMGYMLVPEPPHPDSPHKSSDGGVEGHALSSTLAPQASAVADVVVHRAGIKPGPSDARSSAGTTRDLQAIYNDLLALQDQTDQVPLTTALDAVGAALQSLDAAQPQRISGASNQVEEAACLIWAELCPDMVMGDADLPHYEAAAKAVLALSSTEAPAQTEREPK